jgi:U4/U6 small nuclear ribonucleoprotein PRP31
MSLAEELLNDFSDSELEVASDASDLEIEKDTENSSQNGTAHLKNVEYQIQDLLTITDINTITSIKAFCPILLKLEKLERKLNEKEQLDEEGILYSALSREEQELLSEVNKMIVEIQSYFNILNTFIKIAYSPFWPDLFNIIKNPLLYIRLIKIVKFDINYFKEYTNNEEFQFLPKDQLLSLTMSCNFLLKSQQSIIPEKHTQELILEACDIQTQINDLQLKFRKFIIKRVKIIAPNITALAGPTVSAQLIAAIGLETLSITPACNLPSVGKSTNNSLGYVYQTDIVKNINDDVKKQAVRQLCSKIVLAARVDLASTKTGSIDYTLGNKWREEIQERLEKKILPPENVQIKPLPKPVDLKSKRRGGRKFKKMRERMKMSDIEKAQNKMTFAEEEVTTRDAFGDEIGLGMLGSSSIREIGNVRGVHITKGARQLVDNFHVKGKVEKPAKDSESKLAGLL